VPQFVPDDHFRTGFWARDGPLRLARFTCVECGHVSATLDRFGRHRVGCTYWEEQDARRTAAVGCIRSLGADGHGPLAVVDESAAVSREDG
jgi:hypothetical protein